MADSILYVRGELPLSPGRGILPELVADAKVLLEFRADELALLVSQLSGSDGFLDTPRLREIVGPFLSNEDHARRVARLIFRLDDLLQQSDEDLDDLMKAIEDFVRDPENQTSVGLDPVQLQEVKQRLSIIAKPYPGLRRFYKARRLSQATGQRLEDIQIICDLRPVFDDTREEIEGVIPYTILRIVATGADGLPVAMEVILTRAEVESLAKKSEAAIKKLDRLRTALEERRLSIPPVAMVRQGD